MSEMEVCMNAASQPHTTVAPVPDALRATHTDGTIRVLVVDDSQPVRDLIARKLLDLSRNVFDVAIDTATCGEEAISRHLEEPYDLFFLDVEMPGIGGLEACRRLKSKSHARIAMLSGMNSAEAHAAGRAAGCDNYLIKPPHESDLRSILRLVSLRKLNDH